MTWQVGGSQHVRAQWHVQIPFRVRAPQLLNSDLPIMPLNNQTQIVCRTSSVKHKDKVTDPMVEGRICARNSFKMSRVHTHIYPVR